MVHNFMSPRTIQTWDSIGVWKLIQFLDGVVRRCHWKLKINSPGPDHQLHLLLLYIYICDVWVTFLFRCIQWRTTIRSRIMLTWGHDVTLVVMSCSHTITLWHDIIYDVIWHMLQANNRPGAMSRGGFLVQLSMGKEVHMHA